MLVIIRNSMENHSRVFFPRSWEREGSERGVESSEEQGRGSGTNVLSVLQHRKRSLGKLEEFEVKEEEGIARREPETAEAPTTTVPVIPIRFLSGKVKSGTGRRRCKLSNISRTFTFGNELRREDI